MQMMVQTIGIVQTSTGPAALVSLSSFLGVGKLQAISSPTLVYFSTRQSLFGKHSKNLEKDVICLSHTVIIRCDSLWIYVQPSDPRATKNVNITMAFLFRCKSINLTKTETQSISRKQHRQKRDGKGDTETLDQNNFATHDFHK